MIAVFWMLLLSHLIADYPLQTDWLVSVKGTFWGLSLHAGVHLFMLLVLAGKAMPTLWPYLVGLAAIHYAIDSSKNWLSRARPDWVNGPYIFDQFLHLLSFVVVILWIRRSLGPALADLPLLLSFPQTVLLSGLTLCTVVWYISERVLNHSMPDYQREIVARRWARIGVRSLLFFFFLWLGEQAGLMVFPLLVLAYPTRAFRRRAIVTDCIVALVAALLVMVAI